MRREGVHDVEEEEKRRERRQQIERIILEELVTADHPREDAKCEDDTDAELKRK